MAVRPPESPINISSASPTPTRPTISLPRRSSSRIRDSGAQVSPEPTRPNRRASSASELNEPPVRRFIRPQGIMPPTRYRPTGLALPGPSNPRPISPVSRRRLLNQVIDMTEDDDEDIEITGEAIAPRRRIRSPPDRSQRRDIDPDDRLVDDRRRAIQAIIGETGLASVRQSAEPPAGAVRVRPRQAFIPPTRRMQDEQPHLAPNPPPIDPADIAHRSPPPPRQRIGLGGAVLRRGNHLTNYTLPGPGPVVPLNRVPETDFDDEDRVQTRAAGHAERMRILRARRQGPERTRGMLEGIMGNIFQQMEPRMGIDERDNWAGGHMRGYPGMEEILARLRPAGHGHAHPYLYGQDHVDIPAITAQAKLTPIAPPRDGFTRSFGIDETIQIDQPRSEKQWLACTNCGYPLHQNDGQKSPDDKVWASRCGHFFHQKCLHQFAEPQIEQDRENIIRPPPAGLDVLGEEYQENGRGKRQKMGTRKKPNRKTVVEPVEYQWRCPAKGCGRKHVSVLKDAEWVPDEVEGALPVYI